MVHGGTGEVTDGSGVVSQEQRDPRVLETVNLNKILPGVGFRCVRSARPRLTAADFATSEPVSTGRRLWPELPFEED